MYQNIVISPNEEMLLSFIKKVIRIPARRIIPAICRKCIVLEHELLGHFVQNINISKAVLRGIVRYQA